MKNASTLAEDRLADIVQRVQPMRPIKILLFGSAARGEADHLSDLDIIVEAEGRVLYERPAA